MGIIERELTAPIQNREVASGDEVEKEFDKIFALIGETGGQGTLSDANVVTGANIAGSKFDDLTVPGSKFATDTLPKTSLSDETVMKVFQASNVSTDELNQTESFEDEGISLSLTGLVVDDWIGISFCGAILARAVGARIEPNVYHWLTVSIDAADQEVLARIVAHESVRRRMAQFHWWFQATDTTHTVALRSRVETAGLDILYPAQWVNDTSQVGHTQNRIDMPRTLSAVVVPAK